MNAFANINNPESLAANVYSFNGMTVPDPVSYLLAVPTPSARDTLLSLWIEEEFNLPFSIRQLCDGCFLRVMTSEMFERALGGDTELPTITYGPETFKLHCMSNPNVLLATPLVGVSFRRYGGKLFAVAHVWATKTVEGKGF